MRRLLFISGLMFLLASLSFGQQVTDAKRTYSRDFQYDHNNDVGYSAGYSEGDFIVGNDTFPLAYHYLLKYDSASNIVAVDSFFNPTNQPINRHPVVRVRSDGSFYIIFEYHIAVSLTDGQILRAGSAGEGIAVLLYDSDLNLLSANNLFLRDTFKSGSDFHTAIVDHSDNLHIFLKYEELRLNGQFIDSLADELSWLQINSFGVYDTLITNVMTFIPYRGADYPSTTHIDKDGNFYFAGVYTEGPFPFLDSIVELPPIFTAGVSNGYQTYFVKAGRRGKVQWVKHEGTLYKQLIPNVIDSDADGNIYLSVSYSNEGLAHYPVSIPILAGDSLDYVFAYSSTFFACAKYTPAGQPIWTQHSGGNGNVLSSVIMVDTNGATYMLGTYNRNPVFGSDTLPQQVGTEDLFLAKIDSLGQWERARNLPNRDTIIPHPFGGVVRYYDFPQSIFRTKGGSLKATALNVLPATFDCITIPWGPFPTNGVQSATAIFEFDGSGPLHAQQKDTVIADTICNGDSMSLGGSILYMEGQYFDTLIACNGYDSIIELNLTVLSSTYTMLTDTICSGDSVVFGNTTLYSNGIYYDTAMAANGCDSITELSLIVEPVYFTSQTVSICQGDSTFFGGMTLSSGGMYYDTLPASNACDSVIELNLTVLQPTYNSTSQSICDGDSVVLGNTTLFSSGVYYDTAVAANGCDSITEMSLTVEPVYFTSQTVSICQGDSTFFGGMTLSSGGVYYDTAVAANGCDSITELNLTVLSSTYTMLTDTICSGDSVVFGDTTLFSSGIYYDTAMAANGCDSITELSLTVEPVYFTSQAVSICQGDSTFFGGMTLSSGGVYYDTLPASNACDSIVELILTIDSSYHTNETYTIQRGDTFTLPGGLLVDEGGTYNDTLTAANGCDSIFVIYLVVDTLNVSNPLPEEPVVNIYPNPTAGSFMVECNQPLQMIRVLDILGHEIRRIKKAVLFPGANELSLHQEPQGIYLIEVHTKTGIGNKKILLTR